MTGIHPARDRTISPAFVAPEDWRARARGGYGRDMTRTRKLVAILTIVGASLGAAAPSAVVSIGHIGGGGGRTSDGSNAIGHIGGGGGRISDGVIAIGHIGGGGGRPAGG